MKPEETTIKEDCPRCGFPLIWNFVTTGTRCNRCGYVRRAGVVVRLLDLVRRFLR